MFEGDDSDNRGGGGRGYLVQTTTSSRSYYLFLMFDATIRHRSPRLRTRLSLSLVYRSVSRVRIPPSDARINSWGLFLVHKVTCGKREAVS